MPRIFYLPLKRAPQDDPNIDDLYKIGCLASILQMLKLPDGTVKVLVEGIERARIDDLGDSDEYLSVTCSSQPHEPSLGPELEALRRTLLNQFEQFVKLNKKVPSELVNSLNGIEEFSRLADTVAAYPKNRG